MSDVTKRREQLVEEYLQRNDGNVLFAIEELKRAYKELPLPIEEADAVAYLSARSFLEESLKNNNQPSFCDRT